MRAHLPLAITFLLLLAAVPAADAKPGRSGSLLSVLEAEEGNATLVVVLNTTGGDGDFTFDADEDALSSRP